MNKASKRFGDTSEIEINKNIEKSLPQNTKKSHDSVWRQFTRFCEEKNMVLTQSTSAEEINFILKSWAYNMKKQDGSEYKEMVIKNMWNITAKMIQEMYFNKWNVKINPFSDLIFKSSRDARDSKRKQLQCQPEKRKTSAAAITREEYVNMVKLLDENTPDGLQKKFFVIASYELVWRGGEGAKCLMHYFKEEVDNGGLKTGRIEYNPIFSKSCQGGAQKLAESKWLIANVNNIDLCPVRLYHKFISKRGSNVKTDRMFLTPNPYWQASNSYGWYKNCPAGINEVGKWVKTLAEKSGLDVKKTKICNHSLRSSAVSHLAKAGIGEQQLIKITGHRNVNSINSYLQIDKVHHESMIEEMRKETVSTRSEVICASSSSQSQDICASSRQHFENVTFNNCTFNFK